MKRVKKAGKEGGAPPILNITGLGLDFPRQVTLETLEVLSRSDVIANNLNAEGVLEFLSLFCKDIRTISFKGERAGAWADEIFSMLEPGKTVTFVTRGHPLVSGHLAVELLQRAKKAGIRVRSYSAISTMDEILSLAQEALGETAWGLQVYDSSLLTAGVVVPQRGAPAVVYLGLSSGRSQADKARQLIMELDAVLSKAYPAEHEVVLYAPPYGERRYEKVRCGGLREALLRLDPRALSSIVLYFPA